MAVHKANPTPIRASGVVGVDSFVTILNPPSLDGRVRVGILTPGLNLGGAERWIAALVNATDSTKIDWRGVALLVPAAQHPDIVADVQRACPVLLNGLADFQRLNNECDVVIAWGMPESHTFFSPVKRCRVTLVSQGCGEYSTKSVADASYADELVAVSKIAIMAFPETDRYRVKVLYNPADVRRLAVTRSAAEMRREWGVRPRQKILGYLGRFSDEKNPYVVADAIAALPDDWVGVMVGYGHHEDRLRAHIEKTVDPSRIIMPGPADDIGNVLNAFDWAILPSHEEGCSLSLCETWMAGVPVVATPVGQVLERPDLVRMVPLRPTGNDIAAALLADKRNILGCRNRIKAAKQYANEAYSMENFGRAWTDYLRQIAGLSDETSEVAVGGDRWTAYLRNSGDLSDKNK